MIKYWWEQAKNNFDSAKRVFKAGHLNFQLIDYIILLFMRSVFF